MSDKIKASVTEMVEIATRLKGIRRVLISNALDPEIRKITGHVSKLRYGVNVESVTSSRTSPEKMLSMGVPISTACREHLYNLMRAGEKAVTGVDFDHTITVSDVCNHIIDSLDVESSYDLIMSAEHEIMLREENMAKNRKV